jgi:hypothetical protein
MLVVGVVAVFALGGCTSGGKSKSGAAGGTTTSKVEKNFPAIHVTLAPLDANDTKPPGDDVLAKVKAALDRYVADAVIAPLRTAMPAPDLSRVFTGNVLARITPGSAERAALVDEGFPPASSAIVPDVATALITSVAGPDEVPGLIGVHLDVKVHAVGPTVEFDIVRGADFVLIPDGDAGDWKIDAFQVHASRDSRAAPTTTTVR